MTKVDREAYFVTTYQLLGELGPDAITIPMICQRLDVTKGAFYHRFESLEHFIQAFADHWQTGFLRQLEDWEQTAPDRITQLEFMVNGTASMAHESEAALRSWGFSEPIVRAALSRTDSAAEASLCHALRQFIDDQALAALLAYEGVSLSIGMLHRPGTLDPHRFLDVIADWAQRVLDLEVTIVVTPQGRRARFHDRTS
ncbi:MAG TPA: TetR/AcrR family transcriptional regulator [Sporichthyaceae bacterium]|nr:TetR/AcrR family transcriptional regulator [Sporichthyaceae bacterium]